MDLNRPATRLLATAIALALPSIAVGADWRAKASPAVLQAAAAGAPVDVLIVLRGQPALQFIDPSLPKSQRGSAVMAHLQAVGGEARAALGVELADRGIPYQSLWIANAVAARLDVDTLAAIAQRPDVARVESDRASRADLPRSELAQSKRAKFIEPNIDRVRAPQAWDLGFRGQGVVIGAQDTGYQWDHPALRNRYRGWSNGTVQHAYNWFDGVRSEINPGINPCGVAISAPCDDDSHGTHTLGTALGDDGKFNQIGVAPSARWIGCRNMDSGDGRPSTYLACFQFFLAPTDGNGANPRPDLAPDIITNSWGCPASEQCTLDSFDTALAAIRAAGILNVVAAGNGSASCGSINTPPAISPNVFTIGSTDINDVKSGFSLIGPVTVDGSNRLKPDLMAPGRGVRSAVPGNDYAIKSGTSMATPNVAGVAALVISAKPALRGDPAAIEAILRESALPLTLPSPDCGSFAASAYPNHLYGYGRVDALTAVQRAMAETPLFRSGFEPAAAGTSGL
jgi:serine protease AprX